MGITLAFLAAREAGNLRAFFPRVINVVSSMEEPVELMVVDTTKPLDDTQEVCKAFGVRYINQEGPRYGGAMKTAFEYASMEKIVILDADGSIDIEALPNMNRAMNEGADLIIGSRYANGGDCVSTKSARAMSAICNGCFRLALGEKIRDCSTSYRIYRVSEVRKLLLNSENFDIMEEILCKLRLTEGKDFKVKEIPVHDVDRVEGNSKRSLLKFIYSLGRTLVKMVALRILARNGYQPGKHERQADRITKVTIALVTVLMAVLVILLMRAIIF